jgi:hypothetical protein
VSRDRACAEARIMLDLKRKKDSLPKDRLFELSMERVQALLRAANLQREGTAIVTAGLTNRRATRSLAA